MLRELSAVLLDLQRGVQAAAQRAGSGVRIAQAEMTLPVETALVLQGGSCALLADVARNQADASWLESPSRLTLTWGEVPTDDLPESPSISPPLPLGEGWGEGPRTSAVPARHPSPQPSPQRGEGALQT